MGRKWFDKWPKPFLSTKSNVYSIIRFRNQKKKKKGWILRYASLFITFTLIRASCHLFYAHVEITRLFYIFITFVEDEEGLQRAP